jgi:hypothetical protein
MGWSENPPDFYSDAAHSLTALRSGGWHAQKIPNEISKD